MRPGVTSATTAAANSAITSAQQAAAATQQSMNALTRATQAIQAMQAVQGAAHNLALSAPSSVPNGLVPGGLVVDPSVTFRSDGTSNSANWVNANAPSASTSNGVTTVTINQTDAQALLSWGQFNVGKNTIIDFNQQGNSSWVVLNKITASGVPSQILGSIRADGGVYIINQNGIVFGGSSQVNVQSLIASTLDLNDAGYAKFLNGSGLPLSGTSPTFQGGIASASVWVQAGAQINATGGNVLLLGPIVQNDGAINTPSGQTLLLGGSDATLETGDSYLRGFVACAANGCTSSLTAAGSQQSSATPGTVINNGLIAAPQGNVTVVAGQISQNGVLTSTTSTTKNGSITLRAETGDLLLGGANDNPLYAQYGVAGRASLVQILSDATDTSQIRDTQTIANSSIVLTGANVDIRGIVQLHGYDVTNPTPTTNTYDSPGGITITALGNGRNPVGQVFLETSSLLDTSGTTDAVASASRNSVAVELRINELADSPVVHAGPLYQQTIYVDSSVSGTYPNGTTWQGTPLANASGWIAQTTRSLDEPLDNGAPISIGGVVSTNSNTTAPVNFVQAPGSVINVSGGFLSYTAGFIRVSTLIGADGRLYSASNANPNTDYIGICYSFAVDHPHWGVTQICANPLIASGYFQSGYVQGGAGGSLTVAADTAVFGGTLIASVVAGQKQQTLATAPTGVSFVINSTSGNSQRTYNVDDITLSDAATALAVQQEQAGSFTVDTSLATLLPSGSVAIPSSWLNSGLTNVSLAANDKVWLPAGNPIALPAGVWLDQNGNRQLASFSATANTVDIASSITIPSGTLTLTAAYTSTSLIQNTNFTSGNGNLVGRSGLVTIEAGVTLSTAGLWTNQRNGAGSAFVAPNGGTITINSYFGDIDLAPGSAINVSGGAYETSTGAITSGNGGTLTLAAGLVPPGLGPPNPTLSVGQIYFNGSVLGALQAGQLQGYGVSGGKGGTLNLQDTVVATILPATPTGNALLSQLPQATDDVGNTYSPLAVSTAFFSSGGFANISLTAQGIVLPAGVTLAPQVSSLSIENASAPSATSLAGIATPALLSSGVRPPSSIALHAIGDLLNRGLVNALPYQIAVDPTYYGVNIAGTITTDPLGSVSLTGDQVAVVSGTVSAPGGTINITGGSAGSASYTTPNTGNGPGKRPFAGAGVWVTDTGILSTAGAEVTSLQSNRLPYEDVLPGGQVTITGGYIVLASGSVIDVSGATGLSTLQAAGSGGPNPIGALLHPNSFPVGSAGGTISLSTNLGAVLEGALSAHGGSNAAGGTLNVTLGVYGYDPATGLPEAQNTSIILEPTACLVPAFSGAD
jgi:filamentous hemagglutinin